MSEKFFKVNYDKAKQIYAVKNDKTSIDKFVVKIKKDLGDKMLDISVRGLAAGINNFNFKQLTHTVLNKGLCIGNQKI